MARPPKPINWEIVKSMVVSGMKAVNIASWFDIDVSNFYDRFFEEFGCHYTTYASKFKQNNRKVEDILWMQYSQAMKGNTRMLERLGIEDCGQGQQKEAIKSPNQENIDKDQLIYQLQNKINQLEANGDKSKTG
jgi:hypothetical protein